VEIFVKDGKFILVYDYMPMEVKITTFTEVSEKVSWYVFGDKGDCKLDVLKEV
jgi:hypothetical protein